MQLPDRKQVEADLSLWHEADILDMSAEKDDGFDNQEDCSEPLSFAIERLIDFHELFMSRQPITGDVCTLLGMKRDTTITGAGWRLYNVSVSDLTLFVRCHGRGMPNVKTAGQLAALLWAMQPEEEMK